MIKNKFLATTLLASATLLSCGDLSSTSVLSNQQSQSSNYTDSFEIDADECMTEMTDRLVDSVIFAAQRISMACEKQNIAMEQNGYVRCPTNSCMATHEIGGIKAPSMEIKLTNSSGSSSFGYSSYSSSSSRSTRNNQNIYVTVTVKMNLAADPDKILCVNPISPDSIDKVIAEVISLNTKTNTCG